MESGRPSRPDASGPRTRISTLGRFAIELDGKALRFDRKIPRKPLAVLKALIALGGRSVPVEQLCESVWPELDGDRAFSACKSALSRLRKLIGGETLEQEGQRLSLSESACWVDVHAFNDHLHGALDALEDGRRGEAVTEMDAAIRLYAGPFLDGEFDPPEVIGARERWHGMFTRHLGAVAEGLAEQGDLAAAVRLYRMGLEVDDLAEDFCRGLMLCHRRAGSLGDALSTYRRYQQVLAARMDVQPSPELAALYAEIAQQAGTAGEPAPKDAGPAPAPTDGAPAAVPRPPPETGERRSLTVLDVRVPGISDLIGTGDPEDAEAVVRSVREQVSGIVERHGGLVNQFVRDEMVALFGIPMAREDHARNAARAALEICQALGAAALPAEAAPGALGGAAGIDTGVVVVKRSTDSAGRYAVTGAPMERAARLARQAHPGTVLASAEARRLTAPYFEFAPHPPPRGKAAAGERAEPAVHRVLRETAVQTRFDASTIRGLTAFVGRLRELVDLNAALERATAGQGQCVTVVGEAGIGKSRLVHHFCQGLDPAQHTTVRGRCQAGGENTPYLPWVDALRHWLELDSTASPEQQVASVVERVLSIDPGLERYAPVLLRVLSLRSERYTLPPGLQGEELRAAIREGLGAMLTLSAQQRPLVLVLEDWHWADEASDAALQYLLGLAPSARILLIVTRRPEGQLTWPQFSHHWQQALQPLDGDESAKMARSALGAKALPTGMDHLVYERTGGNPLFIEEMISNLLEEGTLRVHQGVAEITPMAIEPRLPDTVEAVIRSRVDRLDAASREVLQLASVAGREFTLDVLQRVHPEPSQLTACVGRLQAQELIRQSSVLPEATFQFNHAITQTVVYETLLRDRRREVHAMIGQAIESAHADSVDEQPERLHFHAARAEDWARAARFARRSGEKAQALSQFAQAVRFYELGVEHLRQLGGDQPSSGQLGERIDLQLEACFCRIDLGRFDEAQAAGEDMEADVRNLGDPARQVRLMVMLGTCAMYRGEREGCERYLLPTLEMPELQGDALTLANCKHVLAGCYVGQGLWNLAAPYLDEAVQIYERLGREEEYAYGYFALPYVVGCAQLGVVRAFQGRVDDATELFRKGQPYAFGPAANFATKGVFLSWSSVFSALVGDDRLNVQPTVDAMLERAEASDSPFLLLAGRVVQTNLLVAQGRSAEARTLAAQAVEALGGNAIRTGHMANLYYNLIVSEISQGDLDSARTHLAEARPLQPLSPYWFGPRFDMLEGVLADLAGDRERADEWLERSIAEDLQVGAEALADQTRYRQALMWSRAGQRKEAEAQLRALSKRFAERNLPAWKRLCSRALERLSAGAGRGAKAAKAGPA